MRACKETKAIPKLTKQPRKSEKARLAKSFFIDVGRTIFGELWNDKDVYGIASTWEISQIRDPLSKEDRKGVVQDSILEALADGRIQAVLSDEGIYFRNLIYKVWLEQLPTNYKDMLPSHPLDQIDEVDQLVSDALEKSSFKVEINLEASAILQKGEEKRKATERIKSEETTHGIAGETQNKTTINSEEDDDDDDLDDGTVPKIQDIEEALRDKARTYLRTSLRELYWNIPKEVRFNLTKGFWEELLAEEGDMSRKLDWVQSSIRLNISDLDIEPLYPEQKDAPSPSPLVRRVSPAQNRRDRFNWDEIWEKAFEAYSTHLVNTGLHEFRILEPRTALQVVVDDAPWREINNWGSIRDRAYQDYFYIMTIAAWRLLALRPELANKQKDLVEALSKFLADNYESTAKFRSDSRIKAIVRPVLAQFRKGTAHGDILADLIASRGKPRRPKTGKGSSKSAPKT